MTDRNENVGDLDDVIDRCIAEMDAASLGAAILRSLGSATELKILLPVLSAPSLLRHEALLAASFAHLSFDIHRLHALKKAARLSGRDRAGLRPKTTGR